MVDNKIIINLEKNIVTKSFSLKQSRPLLWGSGYHSYLRELECLKLLQNYKNFPKVISYNKNDLEICMEYRGTAISEIKKIDFDYKSQIKDIADALFVNKITYYDIRKGNFVIKNNLISLIDFEWCLYEDSIYKHLFTERFINKINRYKLTKSDWIKQSIQSISTINTEDNYV